jgi:hypothetical protein
VTPEQVDLCKRLATEAAQYRWARELDDDSRRNEAEDARKQARVGFLCDPRMQRAWWLVWEPAYISALDARATQRTAPLPTAWGGAVHAGHARRAAYHARAAHAACLAHAAKTGGACPLLLASGEHLTRVEAWAGGWLDVSEVAPMCARSVPSLPWVLDPLAALRHLAHLVASSQFDQWVFHEEQAWRAAASTLASIDDLRRGERYRAAVQTHLDRLAKEATAT